MKSIVGKTLELKDHRVVKVSQAEDGLRVEFREEGSPSKRPARRTPKDGGGLPPCGANAT